MPLAYLCAGCGKLRSKPGRCSACMRPANKKKRDRENWKTVYNTTRWRKLRARVLLRDDAQCQARLPGCIGVANTVGHTIPFDGPFDPVAWDEAFLEAQCGPCNSREAATRQARMR